ncbi:MAG: RNA methyltransferase [Clostridia bacterium]|nr:RNA methyltransferase [Clostridia bacterium]
MQIITSKDNEIIKKIRKLKEKKYREQEKKYLIEGMKLIEEAVEEKASIDTIVVCEDCVENHTIEQKLLYEIAKYNCIYVAEKVFDVMTEVNNPQGILAVVNKENNEEKIDYNDDMIVVLDGIQDPGNLGTILRTIDSVGLKQVILSEKTADAYNPKVVRSTMGAIFRVNIIVSHDMIKTLKEMKKHKFKILATSLETKNSIYDVDYNKKVLVIGNEANGISKEVLELADETAKIPMLRENRKPKCLCCDKCYFI